MFSLSWWCDLQGRDNVTRSSLHVWIHRLKRVCTSPFMRAAKKKPVKPTGHLTDLTPNSLQELNFASGYTCHQNQCVKTPHCGLITTAVAFPPMSQALGFPGGEHRHTLSLPIPVNQSGLHKDYHYLHFSRCPHKFRARDLPVQCPEIPSPRGLLLDCQLWHKHLEPLRPR